MLRICVAGATGWTGRPVAEAVLSASDLQLVSAVARRSAGRDLGEAWGTVHNGVPVYSTVAEALDTADGSIDVLIDYTSHDSVKANLFSAIERRVAVVVGSSGLSAEDYDDINVCARLHGVGVIASGNFSVTAAMAHAAAVLVSRFLPNCEIIDYADAAKPDAPSGTSRELAEKLALVRPTEITLAVEKTAGRPEARGVAIAGTQIHSVRLPSFVVSTEIVFALPEERLSIRHDAGRTATPYIAGTLLAVRAATSTVGLVRGLETLLLATPQAPGDAR
jgi:4-hydroxy-tetrahydrodipicolinate reductase